MLSIQNESALITCTEAGAELAVFDKRRKTRWMLDPSSVGYAPAPQNIWSRLEADPQPLIPAHAEVDEGVLTVVYSAGTSHLTVTYLLRNDHIEVRLAVPLSDEIGAVTVPGSFEPEDERLKLLLPIMQGMLWDGRGPSFSYIRGDGLHSGFSMAFVGYLGEHGGLLVIAESRDDCRWWFGKDTANRMWATNLQIASLGTMRYERSVRLYLTDPDIVAIAKQYRRRMIEMGRFRNWDEKIAERPALERIFGALMCYVGYCEDDTLDYVESCRKLKAYGFDRALLYPGRFNIYFPDIRMGGVPAINLSRESIEAIKEIGYDMAPWSWLNEALFASPAEVTHMMRRDRDGSPIPHWKIDEQQWYLMCYSYIEEYQKRVLQYDISEMTWDHFDVLSCVPPMECFSHDHPRHLGRPATRSDDRQWIRDAFRADQQAGLIVSSESFNDAYSLEYDFGSVKAWPQYGPWPFWPVPLTMLVYHDSLIHSWWEVHSYNNSWRGRTGGGNHLFEYSGGRPHLMAALDALMGCPPDVFAFGTQYGYTGHGTDTFLYRYRFEDPEVQIALKAALPVAKLHRRIGKQEMVHFKILSEDGYVQETAFADGTRVVANFSRDFVGEVRGIDHKVVKDAGILQPEGWRVSE